MSSSPPILKPVAGKRATRSGAATATAPEPSTDTPSKRLHEDKAENESDADLVDVASVVAPGAVTQYASYPAPAPVSNGAPSPAPSASASCMSVATLADFPIRKYMPMGHRVWGIYADAVVAAAKARGSNQVVHLDGTPISPGSTSPVQLDPTCWMYGKGTNRFLRTTIGVPLAPGGSPVMRRVLVLPLAQVLRTTLDGLDGVYAKNSITEVEVSLHVFVDEPMREALRKIVFGFAESVAVRALWDILRSNGVGYTQPLPTGHVYTGFSVRSKDGPGPETASVYNYELARLVADMRSDFDKMYKEMQAHVSMLSFHENKVASGGQSALSEADIKTSRAAGSWLDAYSNVKTREMVIVAWAHEKGYINRMVENWDAPSNRPMIKLPLYSGRDGGHVMRIVVGKYGRPFHPAVNVLEGTNDDDDEADSSDGVEVLPSAYGVEFESRFVRENADAERKYAAHVGHKGPDTGADNGAKPPSAVVRLAARAPPAAYLGVDSGENSGSKTVVSVPIPGGVSVIPPGVYVGFSVIGQVSLEADPKAKSGGASVKFLTAGTPASMTIVSMPSLAAGSAPGVSAVSAVVPAQLLDME